MSYLFLKVGGVFFILMGGGLLQGAVRSALEHLTQASNKSFGSVPDGIPTGHDFMVSNRCPTI